MAKQVCFKCKQPVNRIEYYWRDYTGHIPFDAVHGGKDINNRTTYIGQGFLKDVGILVGTIAPGNGFMYLPHNGHAKAASVGLKILCAKNHENFRWEPANAANLHLTSVGKHLVIGGCEHDQISNIGRVMYQNQLIVGKVNSFRVTKAKMYFTFGDKELGTESYQVLVYQPKCCH